MKSGPSLKQYENTHWIQWSWRFTQDMIIHWWPRKQSSIKLYKINVHCTLNATQDPGFNLANKFSYVKWNQQQNF